MPSNGHKPLRRACSQRNTFARGLQFYLNFDLGAAATRPKEYIKWSNAKKSLQLHPLARWVRLCLELTFGPEATHSPRLQVGEASHPCRRACAQSVPLPLVKPLTKSRKRKKPLMPIGPDRFQH